MSSEPDRFQPLIAVPLVRTSMSPEWAARLETRGPVLLALGKPQACGVEQAWAAAAAAEDEAAAAAEPLSVCDGTAPAEAVAVPVALALVLALGASGALALGPRIGWPVNG